MSAVMNAFSNKPVQPAAESPPANMDAKPEPGEAERRIAAESGKGKKTRVKLSLHRFFQALLPPFLGIALLVLVWEIVSMKSSGFPSPLVTLKEAIIIFSDPFYQKGPNDQGIGWNILASLKRVAAGFGLAAAIGIPLGFLIGRFRFLSDMFNPIISQLMKSYCCPTAS